MTVTYNRAALLSIKIFMFILLFSISVQSQVVDSVRLKGAELKTIYSKILGENRKITIQAPSSINKHDAYPVLYLLDGEAFTTMVGGQVQYLSEAYKIIPNLIVVGIHNTDRTRDLTPTHSIIGPNGKPDTSANAFGKNSGGGESFLRFIRDELMPYIETNYPTAPYKILAGHSLGGLISLHCLTNHPEYFNAYIALSPSLQWDNKALLKHFTQKKTDTAWKNRVLFFADANEDTAFHRNQLELDSVLKIKTSKIISKRMFYPEENHISEPVKGFYDAIRFVYPSWHLPYNSSSFRKTLNSEIILKHYAELSKKYGYNVVPLHDEIIQISRFLRNDPARLKHALILLQYYERHYSLSSIYRETLEYLAKRRG